MNVIQGNLLDAMSKIKSTASENLGVIIIDETGLKWNLESNTSFELRKENITKTLKHAKSLSCRVICVREGGNFTPKYVYDAISEPDLSCVKPLGLLHKSTNPAVLPYLKEFNITNLVAIGGHRDMCFKESMLGTDEWPGLLSSGITVLTSPSLIGPYTPEDREDFKDFVVPSSHPYSKSFHVYRDV